MSIVGILASNLFAAGAARNTQNTQSTQNAQAAPSTFRELKAELQQLGQDLQTGNLQAARQDYATLQQDTQQYAAQLGKHYAHHHPSAENTQASSRQNTAIAQAFRPLAQDLQAGNLSGAQSAFATLQSDLQSIGGFLPRGSGGASGASSASGSAGLNVTA